VVGHGEGEGDGAFGADLAGGDGVGAIGEDEALMGSQSWLGSGHCSGRGLTTPILMKPSTKTMIPEPMTERQMLVPRAVLLVAGLLRSPKISMPMAIIAKPSATKPWEGDRTGQCVRKYCLRTGSSEMMRNTEKVSMFEDE